MIESINQSYRDLIVYYIDYGNRELKTLRNIRLLDKALSTMPAQAIHCVFNGKLSNLLDAMELKPNNDIDFVVDRLDDGGVGRLLGQPELTLHVRLYDRMEEETTESTSNSFRPAVARNVQESPTSLAPSFFKEQEPISTMSAFTSSCGVRRNATARTLVHAWQPSNIAGAKNHSMSRVFVAHVESPGEFYVRLESDQQTYVDMTQRLTARYGSAGQQELDLLRVFLLKPNIICVVYLEEEESWNRCRIIQTPADPSSLVTVFLMDVGRTLSVELDRLFQLDQSQWIETPSLAWHCRLWGVRPTDHVTDWSCLSTELMLKLINQSTELFQQVYYIVQEEESNADGSFQTVHYVRLYSDCVCFDSSLNNNDLLMCSINDELLKSELVMRQTMLVTCQPSSMRWLSSAPLPPLSTADVIYVNDHGQIYMRRMEEASHHLKAIERLLNWHYNNMITDGGGRYRLPCHWKQNDPCVFR